MKKFSLVLLALIFLAGCQQQEQKYFAESDQTKILEAGIAAYESGDWEKWRSHFSDTAKIYVNSKDPVSLDQRAADLAQMTAAMESYGFDKSNDHIEMVIDKNDETWVYYWATHNGKFANSGKELSLQVHLAVEFAGDKIVEEHIYFDATAMNAEFEAMANMSEADNTISQTINNIKDAWVTNNADMFRSNAHANISRSVNGVDEVKGLDNYLAMVQGNHNMLSDVAIDIKDVAIANNQAQFKWTFSGKHTKDTEDLKATNKAININGFAIWTFDNEGKATHEAVYFSPTDMNMQMGFTLSPPSE